MDRMVWLCSQMCTAIQIYLTWPCKCIKLLNIQRIVISSCKIFQIGHLNDGGNGIRFNLIRPRRTKRRETKAQKNSNKSWASIFGSKRNACNPSRYFVSSAIIQSNFMTYKSYIGALFNKFQCAIWISIIFRLRHKYNRRHLSLDGDFSNRQRETYQ